MKKMSMPQKEKPKKMIDSILLIYHHYSEDNAPTIMEYVNAFSQHSRFPVVTVNTEFGFPPILEGYHFKSIVLHYSLFGYWPYQLNKHFYDYLSANEDSFKVAIFQDEYRFCQPRFRFINDYKIDCIYTCLAAKYIPAFYGKYTRAAQVHSVLTGYVSREILQAAENLTTPDEERTIDISYRGRPLPYYLGKGAQEKVEIGKGFLERSAGLNLNLDIKTGEQDRIYGKEWYKYLANSRGVLGVESGVSFSDIEDRARLAVESYLISNPNTSFNEVYENVLKPFEEIIPIRTISPRHFEAAALRVCQILFEGEYAGVMQPMVHYIPLKKDFSNFNEAIRLFSDPAVRRRITENAYRDLIASGRYSYQTLVEKTDLILEENGLTRGENQALLADIRRKLADIRRKFAKHENKRRFFSTLRHSVASSRFVQRHIKPILYPALVKAGFFRPKS